MPPAPRRSSALAELALPIFAPPAVQPEIPRAIHEARVAAALQRARAGGLDALVVYGDREHCANIAYLSGYDPRFEEALLVLVPDRLPTLILGNEGMAYAELAQGSFRPVLFQPLSLPGQPRDRPRALAEVLAEAGLAAGMRIGVAGWKYYGEDAGEAADWLETPSYIVDALRALAGPAGAISNAGALFMNPRDGLRTINEVEQLAVFEFAATHASQAVRDALFGLKPGMTEFEAVRLMGLNGLPLAAHLMFSTGPRARVGLASPSLRRFERGDTLSMAVCLHGALTARVGFLAEGPQDLPPAAADYLDRLARPYFEAAVAWYETLALGATGGDLWQAVHAIIGEPFFGVYLNPGHLIHLDEWLHSPVRQGSTIPLVSGMALQADIIPATGGPYFSINIEDGVALADEALRRAFAQQYPEAWSRIQRRRAFMVEEVGIRLAPEVLPFSNMPAYLTPYMLAPHLALKAV
jgi:hypothetical protein